MSQTTKAAAGVVGGLGKLTELRQRLLFVLGALIVYRFGTYIPVPGVDPDAMLRLMDQQRGTIVDLFNMFSGGALERFSLFALNVVPYISASIIIQLCAQIFPSLQAIRKEGESGRRKITQWTRYATVLLAAFQAMGVAIALQGQGIKAKQIDTPAGTVTINVPKTAGHDGEPFYPQSLERGRLSTRAVMLAVAEMYVKGVSTREVEAVMREFGIESLSSSQVSRAAKLIDDELEAWRNRPLGEIKYLILDARYEKLRQTGVVRDVAVLSAIGIGPDERRRILGVSIALSEAEVHWRAFLESLQSRGMRGVEYVVSADHAGLRAARKAVLGGVKWQRCQFHLAQNAIHHSPI